MECRVCEQRQRQFYCADCLRIHLREFRNAHARLSSELSAVVQRSEHMLKAIEPGRLERADGAALERSISASRAERDRVRQDNERKRTRVSHLRASIAARRQALSAARTQQAPTPNSSTLSPLAQQQAKAVKLAHELAQTRALLAHHLLNVFRIQQVRGGEWSIGGLVLPVPGDMRRFPAEHINAALLHTLHFLRVLTFYLGIKLPFVVTFELPSSSATTATSSTPVVPGAGLPWIRAGQGPENGGWARWVHKQPLFIKPSTSSTSSSTSSSALIGTRQPAESFTTGLTMLMYNVAYLAHTQGLEIGLAQAGEVVGNLRALCLSPDLGRRSHETRPLLPPPTPPGFALDFAQLLQVTSATPAPRRTHKDKDKERRRASQRRADDEDGWDFVEAES